MIFFISLLLMFSHPAYASNPDARTIRAKVREYREQNELQIIRDLVDLLAIPNVAANPDDIRKNADYLAGLLQKRGIKTQILKAETGSPAVYGELNTPGADKTVMFYMHYDGQPVNPENWDSSPWQPILRDKSLEGGGVEISLADLKSPIDGESRIYARSASDDKSPITAMLTALDALLAAEIPLSVNLKVFLEGEEEAGSPNLASILEKYKDLLQADIWLFCDGPVHQTRRNQVVFGVRGVTGVRMTVYGANRPLHSGHYGNWAPNPIVLLSDLIVSMRNTDAKILIDDYYDDVRPISETERKALAESPDIDGQMREELGLAWSEGEGRLEERIMLPALNVRNIQSGGEAARNAIQTEAFAVLGFRLVPDQTIARVRKRVETHIRSQGFYIVHETPDLETRKTHKKIVKLQWGKGYEPFRTSMDLPVSKALTRVIEEALGEAIVKMPTAGGSLPLFIFDRVLQTPLIIVPMVNHDNNQHAENESLRIQNLWDGIEMYAGILARLGKVWQ